MRWSMCRYEIEKTERKLTKWKKKKNNSFFFFFHKRTLTLHCQTLIIFCKPPKLFVKMVVPIGCNWLDW
jgi:hypothetical protein